MKRAALDRLERHALLGGIGVAILGAALLVAAVVAQLGPAPYVAGAVLLATGLGLVLVRLVRHRTALLASCVAVVLVVGGGAWLGLHGLPGEPDHWEDTTTGNRHLAEGTFRDGNVLFNDGTAQEVSTGTVLWRVPKGSRVLTTTDEVVILSEPTDDPDQPRVIARKLDSGHQVWWAEVGAKVAAVADFEGVLVVTSRRGTTGLDLASGVEVWTTPRVGGTECRHGAPRRISGADLEQRAVFLPSSLRGSTTVDAVRVSDGTAIARDLGCADAGRVIDSTIVQHGTDRLIGRSALTGEVTWERPDTGSLREVQLADAGGVIYVAEESKGRIEAYRTLNLHTGDEGRSAPPAGWTVDRDTIGRQRADVLWQPVHAPGRAGLWQVGTSRVVTVPGTERIDVAEADTSGWAAVVGETTDAVGTRIPSTWAVSPEGTVHGPFDGAGAGPEGDSSIAEGVLRVGTRVYPLD